MSKTGKIELTDEEVVSIWNDGFNSASSILKDAMIDLLGVAIENKDTRTWSIPDESLLLVKSKLQSGYFSQMRVGTRSGMDYYQANKSMENAAERLINRIRNKP